MRRGSRSYVGAAFAGAALMFFGCAAPRAIADNGSLEMDRQAQPIDPAEHVALTGRTNEDTTLQEIRSGQEGEDKGVELLVAVIVLVMLIAIEESQ